MLSVDHYAPRHSQQHVNTKCHCALKQQGEVNEAPSVPETNNVRRVPAKLNQQLLIAEIPLLSVEQYLLEYQLLT